MGMCLHGHGQNIRRRYKRYSVVCSLTWAQDQGDDGRGDQRHKHCPVISKQAAMFTKFTIKIRRLHRCRFCQCFCPGFCVGVLPSDYDPDGCIHSPWRSLRDAHQKVHVRVTRQPG